MSKKQLSHYVVIVGYHPTIKVLEKNIKKLLRSNCRIIIIDNSEVNQIRNINLPECKIVKLNNNMGIAAAQNIGITLSLQAGADIITFFDQDSILYRDTVTELKKPFLEGYKGVIAPCVIDDSTGFEIPHYKLNPFRKPDKVFVLGKYEKYYSADIIISSGTTVDIKSLQKIGYMGEEYFIDLVDIDWSLRCKWKLISIRVNPKAKIRHLIGESTQKVLWFNSTRHSSIRAYYKMRNAFILAKKPYVPLNYALYELAAAMAHGFLSIFIAEKKIIQFRFVCIGILHGIFGVTGKYAENRSGKMP